MRRLLVKPFSVMAVVATTGATIAAIVVAAPAAHADVLCSAPVDMPGQQPVISTVSACLDFDTSFGNAFGFAEFTPVSSAVTEDDDQDGTLDDSADGDPWQTCTVTVNVLANGRAVAQGNIREDCVHGANDPGIQNFETTSFVPLVRGVNYSVSVSVDGSVIPGRSVVVHDLRSPAFRA